MVLNVRLIAFMQNIIFIFLLVFYLFDGLCQICLAGVIKNNKIEVSLYLNIVFRAWHSFRLSEWLSRCSNAVFVVDDSSTLS